MNSTYRVACRRCGGLNDPSGEYCWFCGASLRKQGYRTGGGRRAGRLAARGLLWVISAGVLVAVLIGTYFAVDALLTERRQQTPAAAQSTPAITVSSVSTTTTTTAPRTDRVIAGTDRYGTAIALSKLGFPNGAQALVLAPGDKYVEAVCAAPLAVAYGAPVLLVPSGGISGDLSAEIERLNPSDIFLVGVDGTSRVKRQLRDILNDPSITNLAGEDDYETAVLIADQIKAKLGTISKVILAPSDNFAEAIAAAPLAAAKGWPILLSPKLGKAPAITTDAIAELDVTSALLVGTNAKLALADVETRNGADSYETSALVAEYAMSQGLSFTHTAIATGQNFPDGLAAGPYLALDNGILLLSKGEELPPATLSLLTENLSAIRTLDFIALPGLAADMARPTTTTSTAGVAVKDS